MTAVKHTPSSTMSSNSLRAPPIHYGAPASGLSDRAGLDSLWEGQKKGFIGVFMAVKDGSDTTTDQIDKYILFPSLFPFGHTGIGVSNQD